MVAACGKEVVDLERISMGPLTLDPSLFNWENGGDSILLNSSS